MRKLNAAVLTCIGFLLFSQSAFGQIVSEREIWRQDFINREYRPRWGEPYEHLSHYDMRGFPSKNYWRREDKTRGHVGLATYDMFGDYLLPGEQLAFINWERSELGASSQYDNNRMNRLFRSLVVNQESFGKWQTRFMVANRGPGGGAIRAYFTPSTLKVTRFDGLRWDLSSRQNNVTFLASPGDYPLMGLHWQSVLGDVMTVGATAVSRKRGTLDWQNSDIQHFGIGSERALIKTAPRYVYVFVTNGTPEDPDTNARVYGIKAFINGREERIAFNGESFPVRGRVLKVDNLIHQFRYVNHTYQRIPSFWDASRSETEITFHEKHLRNFKDSWLIPTVEDGGVRMRSAGWNTLLQKTTGGMPGTAVWGLIGIPDPDDPTKRKWGVDVDSGVFGDKGYIEARGHDVIVFEFLIPENSRSLEFKVLADNNYVVDMVAAIYKAAMGDSPGEESWDENPMTPYWNANWNVIYDSKHCAKASGNIQDGSNLRWVSAVYDRMTGMNVYGMNLDFNWKGLFIRGEINNYTERWVFPVAAGEQGASRRESTTRAWFINAEKMLTDNWSVGGEMFNYPYGYMQHAQVGSNFQTIDDNDDNDHLANTRGVEYPGQRNSWMRGNTLGEWHDRYWDNANSSPFVHYYYDENSIVIGDDFNHNGTVDFREYDHLIDLPYERDSRGEHYFLKYRPRPSSSITFGHYDMHQTVQEGRNNTQYMRLEHYLNISGFGEFIFYQRTERVDNNWKYEDGRIGYDYDQHRNEINALRFTNIMTSRLTFLPNTNIYNNVRYSTNYHFGDRVLREGTFDEKLRNSYALYNNDDFLRRYGTYSLQMEHKFDYTWRIPHLQVIPDLTVGGHRFLNSMSLNNIRIIPMVKFVHSHSYSHQSNIDAYNRKASSYSLYPIMRMDIPVMPRTTFRVGVQGVPGLPRMDRNNFNLLTERDRTQMLFEFETRTTYLGSNILLNTGMQRTSDILVNDPLTPDSGRTEFYIMLYAE